MVDSGGINCHGVVKVGIFFNLSSVPNVTIFFRLHAYFAGAQFHAFNYMLLLAYTQEWRFYMTAGNCQTVDFQIWRGDGAGVYILVGFNRFDPAVEPQCASTGRLFNCCFSSV